MNTQNVSNDLELYNREAQNWWKPDCQLYTLHSMNPPRFTFFDRFVKDWKGKQILDVGCGGGFTSEFMAERGAVVSGIDMSAATVETAKSHAKEMNLSINYLVGSAEALPFPDNSFDVITCVDVLEHVPDLGKVLKEIYRVLKPGGTFCFDTINKTWKSKFVMIWLLERITKDIPKGTHDWSMFITPDRMKKALAEAGFRDIELAGFDVSGVDKVTKKAKVKINDNMSVMYIGKTVK